MQRAAIPAALVLVVALAACQPHATTAAGAPPAAVGQCQAQSGYAARAAAARAAGVEGDVVPTGAEQQAIATCLGARSAPVSAPLGGSRTCSLVMVGGDGYRCARHYGDY